MHAEIDALEVPPGHLFGPDLLRARAWLAVARGVPSDGYAHLEAAAAMARAGGAVAYEAGALHDLARLGRAARVAPRLRQLAPELEGPVWPVSAAQRLAARGLANKEIAERLCLSHRTVENRLHTCYAKLGAGGRADLAQALSYA